jgi:methionyl-tRNA formyltransferase
MVFYILASKLTPYARVLFNSLVEYSKTLPTKPQWDMVNTPSDLITFLKSNPNLSNIFFFHWNWIVPSAIYTAYPCVVIHTSNLPKGRGGSPLQNQIVEGVWQSRVNALKMVGKIDAGDIYCSEPITLQGSIQDIWWTIMLASEKIIRHMINNPDLVPTAQLIDNDTVQVFKRRNPSQSALEFETAEDLTEIYDHIRMLDGLDYPKANLNIGNFNLEFSRAQLSYENEDKTEVVLSDVRIRLN